MSYLGTFNQIGFANHQELQSEIEVDERMLARARQVILNDIDTQTNHGQIVDSNFMDKLISLNVSLDTLEDEKETNETSPNEFIPSAESNEARIQLLRAFLEYLQTVNSGDDVPNTEQPLVPNPHRPQKTTNSEETYNNNNNSTTVKSSMEIDGDSDDDSEFNFDCDVPDLTSDADFNPESLDSMTDTHAEMAAVAPGGSDDIVDRETVERYMLEEQVMNRCLQNPSGEFLPFYVKLFSEKKPYSFRIINEYLDPNRNDLFEKYKWRLELAIFKSLSPQERLERARLVMNRSVTCLIVSDVENLTQDWLKELKRRLRRISDYILDESGSRDTQEIEALCEMFWNGLEVIRGTAKEKRNMNGLVLAYFGVVCVMGILCGHLAHESFQAAWVSQEHGMLSFLRTFSSRIEEYCSATTNAPVLKLDEVLMMHVYYFRNWVAVLMSFEQQQETLTSILPPNSLVRLLTNDAGNRLFWEYLYRINCGLVFDYIVQLVMQGSLDVPRSVRILLISKSSQASVTQIGVAVQIHGDVKWKDAFAEFTKRNPFHERVAFIRAIQ